MIRLTLEQVSDVVGGELARPPDRGRAVTSVRIDSRRVSDGTLFVPLPGSQVDGHAFIEDASARGAGGYLVAAGWPLPAAPGAIVVDDPADALTGLGAWVRREVDPVVVGVTGSSGKTTTKDLIAAATGAGRRTVASPGSYNNELGVPLTCCLLTPDTEVLVAEVGARGIGHIAALGQVLLPDIAVVTIIGQSHLSELGTVEAVARAKTELVDALGVDGVAILNADDERVAAMAPRCAGRVITYGRGEGADWRATAIDHDQLARARFEVNGPRGRASVALPVPGAHNVSNALAALAVADACGVALRDAAAALSSARVSPWRMQVQRTADGVTILNDAYNANPPSTAAALETLVAFAAGARRWAVLGQMAELGEHSAAAHSEVGRRCAELGLDGLVVVGEDAAHIGAGARSAGFAGPQGVELVRTPAEAVERLRGRLAPGDVVLVKASRAVGLERVAAALVDADGDAG